MTFTDDLTLVLDLLVLVTVALFYTGLTVWISMRRDDRVRANAHLQGGATLLGLLGGLILIIAIWGELTWPLNYTLPDGSNVLASYDILFFDSLFLLGFLLIAFYVAVRRKFPTHLVGMLAVVGGIGIGFYGYRAWTLSLTLDPLETLLLFLGFVAVSIGAYPITLYVDWFVVGPTTPGSDLLPSDPKPRPQYRWMWNLLIGAFLLFVVLAGIAALWYGYDAAWAHLGAPP